MFYKHTFLVFSNLRKMTINQIPLFIFHLLKVFGSFEFFLLVIFSCYHFNCICIFNSDVHNE